MELPRKNDEVKLIKMEKYISKNIILLVLISTLIFASKWFLSFYYFKDSIDIKLISLMFFVKLVKKVLPLLSK